MVEFGNKPIEVTEAPAPKRKPEPPDDTGFGGEPGPELSETPVIDEEQSTAPVESDAFALTQDGLDDMGEPSIDKPPETGPKVTAPKKATEKPKPKKKNKNKHNKKKRRHGR